MTYFGQKVRTCLIHADDIELTVLKVWIRRWLENGKAVSYKNKLYLMPSHNGGPIRIIRLAEPDVAIEIPCKRTPDAVDRFIDAFVFETEATLDQVLFYESSDINLSAQTWQFIKYSHTAISFLILGNKPQPKQDVVQSQEGT